jgi:curli biogenesis system outer membrane secretion channel CsgG
MTKFVNASWTALRNVGATVCCAAALFACVGEAGAIADENAADKPVLLIPPFENQSQVRHKIAYEVGTDRQEGRPTRQLMVDRLTEAPRSVLEDMLVNFDGITVVERQRIDAFLVETEFGGLSGLVDEEKAAKLGKLLGANLIVLGTITDIHEDVRDFQGYGVRTRVNEVKCQIRVRLLDIASGTVRFSQTLKGTKTYNKSSFGQTASSDRAYAAVEAALETLRDDERFKAALFGKRPEAKGELVEVEFAPKPDNCDIEIDGKYVGGSPQKRRLPAGKEVKVRIAKGGFKEWERTISPEKGLKITPELGRGR